MRTHAIQRIVLRIQRLAAGLNTRTRVIQRIVLQGMEKTQTQSCSTYAQALSLLGRAVHVGSEDLDTQR